VKKKAFQHLVLKIRLISVTLGKALKNNHLVIDQIGGAGNLSYKLTLLGNSLCVYHTFLDNDDAGRSAYKKAVNDGLLSIKSNTFVNCLGMPDTELEDCLAPDVYKQAVLEEFGVTLDSSKFRGSMKWSDRVRAVFQDQGKLWDDHVEAQVKNIVANAVSQKTRLALHPLKRNSIDALVSTLESLVEKGSH